LGERAHLIRFPIDLSTHVDDVVGLIEWEGLSDVVLCGHSYGGMVISGAAERIPGSTLRSIVFVDALVPENGFSVADYARLSGENPSLQPNEDVRQIPPPPAEAFGLTGEDAAWAQSRLTAQPAATFLEKAKVSGARERIPRKVYILATQFQGLPQRFEFAADARVREGWSCYEVPCGHDVMIEMPQRLADIMEAAGLTANAI
jgi:pimeloyl-ACP methyl ester carboxylesterase